MTRRILHSPTIVTADPDRPVVNAVAVEGNTIIDVGDVHELARAGGQIVELGGPVAMPGVVDAHTHLLQFGQALGQVDLSAARNLAEIHESLRSAREDGIERIHGRSWLFSAVPGGHPTAAMLDEVVNDIPVYLDANDYHSCWLNTAALVEAGIDDDTPDPIGGRIARDVGGRAEGLVYETAVHRYVWPLLQGMSTDADRDEAIDLALDTYVSSGVVAVVDMAMDDVALQALQRAGTRRGGLPIRVHAHWLIGRDETAEDNLAQVDTAITRAKDTAGSDVEVVGIKLMIDGVIDACTAAMRMPYADGSNAEPIWSPEALAPVVAAADAAGLQIAIHAIGDRASEIALDALEAAAAVNGPISRRHRIEHLETVTPESIQRLAALGITASMQPVHADPAIQENWRHNLGDDRVDEGYPWRRVQESGARLAFGTDAPTAPHHPLANLFIAATRRSAIDPSLPANSPHLAVSLTAAIGHSTSDAAASSGDELRGVLRPGARADLIVLDRNPLDDPDSLLQTAVVQTIVGGRTVWSA